MERRTSGVVTDLSRNRWPGVRLSSNKQNRSSSIVCLCQKIKIAPSIRRLFLRKTVAGQAEGTTQFDLAESADGNWRISLSRTIRPAGWLERLMSHRHTLHLPGFATTTAVRTKSSFEAAALWLKQANSTVENHLKEGKERLAQAAVAIVMLLGNTHLDMLRKLVDDLPVLSDYGRLGRYRIRVGLCIDHSASMWSKPTPRSLSGASSWRLTRVTSCLTRRADPAPLLMSPNNGAAAGSRSTPAASLLALARTRFNERACYPYYLLADSRGGLRAREQAVSGKSQSLSPAEGDIRQGFVYERAPHVTLKSIANNAEIDVIWDEWQARLEPLRAELNGLVGEAWEEWRDLARGRRRTGRSTGRRRFTRCGGTATLRR